MATRLPAIKIAYLESLTDDTGVFQHAKYSVPRRNEGYTTDDNARALIVCARHHCLKKNSRVARLANVYLAFLHYMQKPEGSFHNYLSYERGYLDVDGSDDSLGRALWSFGCVMNSNLPNDLRLVSKDIFDKGLPFVWKSTSLRCYAHTILGLCEYYRAYPDNNLKLSIEKLADNLIEQYQFETRDDWHWFEQHLTYDNARLPEALFEAYAIVDKQRYLDVAKASMAFQTNTQMVNGKFVPIGNNGWYKRGGERAFYDQQPLEACAMAEASIDAFYATKDKNYLKIADTAFQWFLGKNTNKAMMYNPVTSGCFDGITPGKINLNQGAESSISYLMARLKLEEVKQNPEKRQVAAKIIDNTFT